VNSALAALIGIVVVTIAESSPAAEGPGDTKSLPCRPTIACTADIVPPGAVEVEAGSLTRILGPDRQVTFPFLAKLTLAEWVQVQIGSNGYTSQQGPDGARYFDNVIVGAKLHLVDQGDYRPSVSLSAAASLPVGSQPADDDALFIFYVTKDVGPVHADLNAGLSFLRLNGGDYGGSQTATQEWAALALSMNLPPPFGVMVEGYYFSDASPAATRDGGILLAVSHSPKPWLVFDVGADVGYFPSSRAFSAFVGMTVVPFLLWKEKPKRALHQPS
jgi:hypothetical protein